jgi:hypothetical protein
MRALLLVALAAGLIDAAHAGCIAQSGERTLPLVELYSASHCAGCARAELWLRTVSRGPRPVLAVALTMEQRDAVGEPRVQSSRKLTLLQRMALVDRPHVVLQGREFSDWDTDGLGAALAAIHAREPAVRLRLEIVSLSDRGMEVVAAVHSTRRASPAAALYLAGYAARPDGVSFVREWQGPLAVAPGASVRRLLPVSPGTAPANSGVVGLLQDSRTAEVLQALRLPAC